nr:hypothetical protein [Citrobacter freundii]
MTSFIKVPFASSGDKVAVPDTDAGGGVNMTQGYGQAYSLDPATDPSAKRIERDKMNWLFNIITKAINEIQSSGVAPFITAVDNGGSAFSYAKGALVSLGGVNYINLYDNNLSTPPSSTWSAIPDKIQPLDGTLTALAALTGAANKLPYFNGVDTATLTDLTDIGRNVIGQSSIASLLAYLGLDIALNDKQPLDATLSALADLANSSDKLPYFSGPDQMASTDLTSFMRGLLGKADAATAKVHLGVGSAGGRNIGNGFSAGGSEVPDMTFFTGLKGAAGYQYFPNGMLLQWGTVTLKAAPSGTSIGTFPVAFPAAGQQIFVTYDNPSINVQAFGAASIIDPTQFRVNALAINADTFTMAPGYDLTLRWFAIG